MVRSWPIPIGRPRTNETERVTLVYFGGRIPQDLDSNVREACEKHGLNNSEGLRIALQLLLDHLQQKEQADANSDHGPGQRRDEDPPVG